MSLETKTSCAFIDDGYTEPFEIPEVPGVSKGLKGLYRPMTPRERNVFFTALDHKTYATDATAIKPRKPVEETIDDKVCEAIVRHLVEWDLTDRHDNPVPLTAANVSRLYPAQLQVSLVDIISGLYARRKIANQIVALVMDSQLSVEKRTTAILKLMETADSLVLEDQEKNSSAG